MSTETPRGRTNWAAEIEAYLLAGIGAMLLRKAWANELAFYIHPRYTPLIFVTGIVLIVLGAVRVWQASGTPQALRGRIGIYGLLLAPLVLGMVIPASPAGSALIDPSQLNTVGSAYAPELTIATEDTTQWTILDWTFASYNTTAGEARGKPVDVVGFVYRDPEQPSDEFLVARYTLACCVADRSGVSMVVKWPDAATLVNDQWVRVSGTIEAVDVDGVAEFTVVNVQVEPVAQPDMPYLYQ